MTDEPIIISENIKICSRCNISKPCTDFYKFKRNDAYRYYSFCKLCRSNQLKEKNEEEWKKIPAYKRLKGAIRNLTDDEFEEAKRLVASGINLTQLSHFVKCSRETAKRYVEAGVFSQDN